MRCVSCTSSYIDGLSKRAIKKDIIFHNQEGSMLLTIFLAIVFCAAMAMMLISCVAFIQDNKFFSSAPKEKREVLIQREQELFYGAG